MIDNVILFLWGALCGVGVFRLFELVAVWIRSGGAADVLDLNNDDWE